MNDTASHLSVFMMSTARKSEGDMAPQITDERVTRHSTREKACQAIKHNSNWVESFSTREDSTKRLSLKSFPIELRDDSRAPHSSLLIGTKMLHI